MAEITEIETIGLIRIAILALDMPFLLLPFRPASDPSAARSFIRNYFDYDKNLRLQGEGLEQELRLTEPMVRMENVDATVTSAKGFRSFVVL